MSALNAIAWTLNVWVVLTYLMMVRGKWSEFRFDLANALGFVPTAAVTIMAGAYPALVLTFSFGFIGLYGTVRELFRRYHYEAAGITYVVDEWDSHEAHLKAYNDLRQTIIARQARLANIEEDQS